MIVNNIHYEPKQVKTNSAIMCDFIGGGKKPTFPLLRIDRDSYIVSAQLQSGINFDSNRIHHNLQIGRYCSLADKITFMVGLNHDYIAVTTAACSFLDGVDMPIHLAQKNQIIIQNDVWVGSGATIMSGVTIHNGAVVACDAHVVKDVPPYAVVGGNPAKIIKYRFDLDEINKLQTISWWNWSGKKLRENRRFFTKSVDEFIDQFYEKAVYENEHIPLINYKKTGTTYLFFPDFNEDYPIAEHVIRNYVETYGCNKESSLLLYIKENSDTKKQTDCILQVLKKLKFEDSDNVELIIDHLEDERPLFKIADYYITNRNTENVLRTCYADQYNVKTLSGVDEPIFRN